MGPPSLNCDRLPDGGATRRKGLTTRTSIYNNNTTTSSSIEHAFTRITSPRLANATNSTNARAFNLAFLKTSVRFDPRCPAGDAECEGVVTAYLVPGTGTV